MSSRKPEIKEVLIDLEQAPVLGLPAMIYRTDNNQTVLTWDDDWRYVNRDFDENNNDMMSDMFELLLEYSEDYEEDEDIYARFFSILRKEMGWKNMLLNFYGISSARLDDSKIEAILNPETPDYIIMIIILEQMFAYGDVSHFFFLGIDPEDELAFKKSQRKAQAIMTERFGPEWWDVVREINYRRRRSR